MKEMAKRQNALGKLRETLVEIRKDSSIFEKIVSSQDQVLARFQPIFTTDYIDQLSEDEFRSFLLDENNRHWTGLQRQGPKICADMLKLRKGLQILLDEDQPIEKRLNKATDMVTGIGKAIATAILLVAHPNKYGVWNNTSEGGLKKVNLWPQFDHGESFGERYLKVNKILISLAEDLNVDLWTLDTLWWKIKGDIPSEDVTSDTLSEEEQRFGLERHLHEFLRDNWNNIELEEDWSIYSDEGDDEAGYEYPCDIGYIDILAHHRNKQRWLVIELKRNQSSDTTVGQVLRYMGWVKKHLAKKGDKVQGLIISHQVDDRIQYALNAVEHVDIMLYEVNFRLRKP